MIYLGLDDFSERVNNLDLLWRLNDYFDDFKVNLFTIPSKTPTKFFRYIKSLKWISVCLHGNRHVHNEVISTKNLRKFAKQGYAKVYRPPFFELTERMKVNLEKEGFYIANDYTWNIRDPVPKEGFGFGHIYPHDYRSINDNPGESLFLYYKNIMKLPKDTNFGLYENIATT